MGILLSDGAEIGRCFEEAAAVPTEEFAVDEADGGVGEGLFYFFDMALAKGIGFGRKKDVEVVVAGEACKIDGRIAVVAGEDVAITGIPEHVIDEGVAAGGHVWFAPDKICGGRRFGQNGQLPELAGDGVGEGQGLGTFVRELSDPVDHVEGIRQRFDIADPDGIARCEGFYLGMIVFLFVGDDQVRLERIDAGGVHGLCASDAGFVTKPCFGADAEFGDADDGVFQAKRIQ